MSPQDDQFESEAGPCRLLLSKLKNSFMLDDSTFLIPINNRLSSIYTLLMQPCVGFFRQNKGEEGSIFYEVKCCVFFRLFCLTNPALASLGVPTLQTE
jgi:hypothetical protein